MKRIKLKKGGFAFQGDIAIMLADDLPQDAKAQPNNIVAHSETGHHHVAERAEVFHVPDGETLYLQALGKSVDIVHKREYDTHETIRLEGDVGTVYKIRRQREFTPEGWRRVED